MRRWMLALLFCVTACVSAFAQESPTNLYTTVTNTVLLTNAVVTTLWTPASGNRFLLQGCLISVSNGTYVTFYDNATIIIQPIMFNSTGQLQLGGNWSPTYANTAVPVSTGTKLRVSSTGASTSAPTSVTCWGWESPS